MTSLFTRIIRREAPAEIIYETKREIAFLDIYPASDGHTLVVPKLEVASFEQLPPADAQSLVLAVQYVARGLTQALKTPHYNLMLNNGAAAGQVIWHVHVHVIPRWEGVPRHKQPLVAERGRELGELLRKALAEPGPALR